MQRYSDAWRGLGCATVIVTPTIPFLWFDRFAADVADRLLRALPREGEAPGAAAPPVLLQMFSGAAQMFLPLLSTRLRGLAPAQRPVYHPSSPVLAGACLVVCGALARC